jgi:hypothetical protein
MYRISRNGHEPIVDVDQVAAIEPVIRASPAGRYHVDEMSTKPLPSGHCARRWGVGIKRADGSVVIEPDPWEKLSPGGNSALPQRVAELTEWQTR